MTNHHSFSSKNVIEIGTTREKFSNQSSTIKISKVCDSLGLNFTTVDMDPENTQVALKDLKEVNANHNAVTRKGEDYLKDYNGQISMLYLDAFDTVLSQNHHSNKRKASYEKNLNCDITNELCWKMHLECCVHVEDKIEIGGFICIDDIYNDVDYFGKGKTAIPYLIDTGKYDVIEYMPDAIILKRIK